MEKKILVIGTGFLGRNLIEQLKKRDNEIIGTSYQNLKQSDIFLDINDLGSIKKLLDGLKPKIIINCAANTNVDYLETHPDEAFSINAYAPRNLAVICNKNNIKLIQISTNSVFDGRNELYSEKDVPNPINIYAKSKLLGENLVIENLSNYIIIRTNFFGFNHEGKFLFNSILNTLSENKEFIGFDDVVFNPLEITNLAQMIDEIANSEFRGIINLSSNDVISKYQFAQEIAKVFHFDLGLVKKGLVDDIQFDAIRPKNTSLSNEKSKSILKTKIISIKDSLEKIKHEKFTML